MSAPVRFRLVDDLMAEGNEGVPGLGKWWASPDGEQRGLHFWCPCGCGELLGVRVAGPPAWTWDGNREKPTVSPSILHTTPGGCGWHGFLRNGEFTSA